MDLREFASILRRRKLTIVLSALAVLLCAVLATMAQSPLYLAEAEVLVQVTAAQERFGESQDSTFIRERDLQNEVAFANSDRVKAASDTAFGEEIEIDVVAGLRSDTLTFIASHDTAEGAAEAANTYSEAFVSERLAAASDAYLESSVVLTDQLKDIAAQRQNFLITEAEVALLDAQEAQLNEALQDLLVVTQLSAAGSAQPISAAEIPTGPSSPNWLMNLAAALVLGPLLGVGAAYARDSLDDKLRDENDLKSALSGLPVLATISAPVKSKSLIVPILQSRQSRGFIEGVRGLRSAIRLVDEMGDGVSSILVTSANPSEGKSTTASSLAISLARSGLDVLLIDFDLRRPTQHKIFGVPVEGGISEAIEENRSPHGHLVSFSDAHLTVVTAGKGSLDPADATASRTVEKLVAEFKSNFDMVIIDTPPVLPVADTLALSRVCDANVIVARRGETTKAQLQHAIERLERAGANIIGSVFTGSSSTSADYGYGEVIAEEEDTFLTLERVSLGSEAGLGYLGVDPEVYDYEENENNEDDDDDDDSKKVSAFSSRTRYGQGKKSSLGAPDKRWAR